MIENTRQNTEIFKNSKQKIQCNKFVDCFDHSEFYIASQKS